MALSPSSLKATTNAPLQTDAAIALACLIFILPLPRASASPNEPLSFNRDIRPILAGNCYDCHGPDDESRKAKLRLDDRKSAADLLAPDGEFIARITSTDADDVMPPPESHQKLEPIHIDLLRQWVDQGAPYEKHWAFEPPQRPDIPAIRNSDWPENPIDHFIAARLEKENLTPSPEADPYTIVRRLYLDLIGLPPTPKQADDFVKTFRKNRSSSIEQLVNRLLANPQYGERWARPWLDLARYADTNGYEKDRPRSIWPYRDWVINALNDDMPYDQFTIEQLAGDMLPNPTRAQRVATGFHRNTMTNEEGGIDPLEYRYYSMVDRVATTGTVWLGLTTGCAQCHTHKYDPITHTDYFSLMALLNNADEPDLDVPDEEISAQRAALKKEITQVEDKAITQVKPAPFNAWLNNQRDRAVPWTSLTPGSATSNLPRLQIKKDGAIFVSGDHTKRDVYTVTFPLAELEEQNITALRLEVLPHPHLPAHGPGIGFYEGRRGDFFLSEISATANGTPVTFSDATHSYGKISVGSGDANATNVIDGEGSTGWSTSEREGEKHHLVLNLTDPLPTKDTELTIELIFERHFAAALGHFRFDATTSSKKAVAADTSDAPDPLTATPGEMKRHYVRTAKPFAKTQKQINALKKKLPDVPATLVLRERPADNPRPTHRHHRGEYLNAKEKVRPRVPEVFPQLPENEPPNRLSFARWLVSDDNPLAARVAVNRAWQAIFGRGLVVTADDFGTQARAPSHPELLDWLAREFVENGWSHKHLHRLLVTSATYRQSSAANQKLLKRDPHNELLARSPRFRLDGETVRDTALSVSGLLSKKMLGPSVYPPQPASITEIAYGKPKWQISTGEDRYRRSLYTFSKRTAPFAAYSVFDAPTGESCVAKRNRSNTPLQALTLLNDAMFLEMAEALAQAALKQPGNPRAQITQMFRRTLTRPPTNQEINSLLAYYQSQLKRFQTHDLVPADFLSNDNPTPRLAAYTLVARALLNLDETITKS
ncbi:MAG: PSD1 and planctomycete cytochrome C domain-containing protein [Verrucomicrobiota bacterium]